MMLIHQVEFYLCSAAQEGYNGGRQYIFSLESDEIFEEWDSFIEKQAALCFKRHTKRSQLEELRVGLHPPDCPRHHHASSLKSSA